MSFQIFIVKNFLELWFLVFVALFWFSSGIPIVNMLDLLCYLNICHTLSDPFISSNFVSLKISFLSFISHKSLSVYFLVFFLLKNFFLICSCLEFCHLFLKVFVSDLCCTFMLCVIFISVF